MIKQSVMDGIKDGAVRVFAGAALWLFSLHVQALVILQYHHIAADTPAATSTTPATFEDHLKLINQEGFSVISLEKVSALIRNEQSLPDKTVLITFDDSYSSIYTTAFPLLKRYGYPFVVFANTSPVEAKQKSFMTWQQLKEMTEHGGNIANHTNSHTHMVRRHNDETEKQWRKRIKQEIQQANQLIRQHTGQNHRVLAYPYGEFNPEIINLLKKLDYLGMGQHSGPVAKGDRYAIPRFPMGGPYGGKDDFILKLNTLPFEQAEIALMGDGGTEPFTPIISDERRPTLMLSLDNPELIDRVICYVSPKDDTEKKRLSNTQASFRAVSPLPPGRSRYNCTARANSDRYYWLSVPFIARQSNGEWLPE